LITCGGDVDREAHSYRDNIVVYAGPVRTSRGRARNDRRTASQSSNRSLGSATWTTPSGRS
jgi:hypothetical protein